MNSWTNVPGTLILDAGIDEDGNWYLEHEKELPYDVIKELRQIFPFPKVEGEVFIISINFISSGNSTPARTSGPAEDCYPAEYEDKREVDEVEVKGEDDKVEYLSLPVAKILAARFEEEINVVGIDVYEHEG